MAKLTHAEIDRRVEDALQGPKTKGKLGSMKDLLAKMRPGSQAPPGAGGAPMLLEERPGNEQRPRGSQEIQ